MSYPLRHAGFALVLLLVSAAGSVQAQGPWAGALAAGWTATGGYDLYWNDNGIFTLRGSVWRRIGNRLDLGLDGAWHHFGRNVETFPGEEIFTTVAKPTAWDAALALRWRPSDQGRVRPQGTFGLGILKRRASIEETSRLPDGTVTFGPARFTSSPGIEPLATLGVTTEVGPPGGRLAFTVAARVGISLHDPFDGGGLASVLSLLAGVAVR
jgi:hypothetical protein